MRIMYFVTCITAVFSLSACTLSQNQATSSGFTTPSPTGAISGDLSSQPIAPFIDGDGDGFSFTAGSVDGEGLRAEAGLVEGTSVNFRPSVGSGTYQGVFALTYIDDIALNGNFIGGQRDADVGALTLTADFGANTLTSTDSALTVNGVMDGRSLSGSVTYRGLTGDLRGLVGGDKTIGSFHANNADLIYAGGFGADRE
jgi:hypothetical protein